MSDDIASSPRLGIAYPSGEWPAAEVPAPPGPSDSAVPDRAAGAARKRPALGQFELEFRHEVAQLVYRVLVRAGGDRGAIEAEAAKRGLSLEELLAAYLTRIIMDKVDREYL